MSWRIYTLSQLCHHNIHDISQGEFTIQRCTTLVQCCELACRSIDVAKTLGI